MFLLVKIPRDGRHWRVEDIVISASCPQKLVDVIKESIPLDQLNEYKFIITNEIDKRVVGL
jgi:hypothetical protein